jgi:hypothetical protein
MEHGGLTLAVHLAVGKPTCNDVAITSASVIAHGLDGVEGGSLSDAKLGAKSNAADVGAMALQRSKDSVF